MPCGFDAAGAGEQIATISERPEWQALRAVRDGRVYPVDANGCFSRPGPRLVDGIETLARCFHGRREIAPSQPSNPPAPERGLPRVAGERRKPHPVVGPQGPASSYDALGDRLRASFF